MGDEPGREGNRLYSGRGKTSQRFACVCSCLLMAYLDPQTVRFWFPEPGSRARCEIAGDRCLLEVRVHRCFPFSLPTRYVSVQDASSNEAGILADLDDLDPASRGVVESELDRRYFTPIIGRIVTLRQEASMWWWSVETQRGPASFYIRGVRDSIHEVAPRRWQILSMDGQRYEISDIALLDSRSQALFEGLF